MNQMLNGTVAMEHDTNLWLDRPLAFRTTTSARQTLGRCVTACAVDVTQDRKLFRG